MSADERLDVDVSAETGRLALGRERAATLARAVLRAEGARRATLSIAFVSKRRIASINRRHLGHEGPTDVISFGLEPALPGDVQGDIYIAPDVARENARRHGVPVREELARLVVHGTLHVLGHDHPDGARERSPMWRRQERLLRRALGGARAPRRAPLREGAR
jgi:probable rRNA maturation factor